MVYKNAVETLLKERDKFISEKKAMGEHFDGLIRQFESTIEVLTGKKVWEVEAEHAYDDENPDYIKGSIEN